MRHAGCALRFAFWNMAKVLGVGAIVIALAVAALAHNGYDHYRNPVSGVSCCDNRDCRAMPADEVEERLREVKGGVTVDGAFIPDAQLQEGPDGRWHICEGKRGGFIFCVLKPRPSF